jgi:all-trans-8'-apo-beta-carotenal 15,15'-oxygenase
VLSSLPLCLSPTRSRSPSLLRAGECIAFDASKTTTLWLIPRNGSPPKSFTVPTHFAFHHANAFEDERGRVVLDSACSPTLELGSTSGAGGKVPTWEAIEYAKLPYTTMSRYTLDPKTGTTSSRLLCDRHVEFPSVNPRLSTQPHRFIFAAAGGVAGEASPMRGVLKVDTSDAAAHQLWLAPAPNQFVGEPVFAPKRGATADSAEDDGYILVMMLDGARESKAALLVLDAADVAKGPIATLKLDTYLPHGLHGTYVPDLAPSGEDILQATTLMNMYARKSREWNVVDGSFSGMGFKTLFQKGVDGR